MLSSVDDSDFAGKQAEVVKAIKPDKPGRVRFEGTTWKAVSFDETMKAGEKVEILRKESLTFVVTKSILGNDIS